MAISYRKHKRKAALKRFSAIDLFSGCGGLTAGLKLAGFKVVGAVEKEKLAVETYRHNHRKTKVKHGDIRNLDATEFRRELKLRRGGLDLLAGCPPCQGFSSLRTLQGTRKIRDRRNDLVFEFLRFVKEFKPKAIMMENVPGLASDHRIESLCRSLRGMGYSCEFRVINAAHHGVPQRRRRMILLGGKYGRVSFAQKMEKIVTVRDAIKELPHPKKSSDSLHRAVAHYTAKVARIIRRIPTNGGSRHALGDRSQLTCHETCNGFNDIYGRMAWDEVAPTITSGCINPSKGRFLHPRQHRAITLREAALLQTFPANYYISLSRGKYPAAEMIGNALPPKFIRAHAKEIAKYLGKKGALTHTL